MNNRGEKVFSQEIFHYFTGLFFYKLLIPKLILLLPYELFAGWGLYNKWIWSLAWSGKFICKPFSLEGCWNLFAKGQGVEGILCSIDAHWRQDQNLFAVWSFLFKHVELNPTPFDLIEAEAGPTIESLACKTPAR